MGAVHSFESFGTVDGPGIRFVVFMQGCPMRCLYCHNPDTQPFGKGKEYTPQEVAKNVLRYRNYFSNGGGVTVSGGEPLAQVGFLKELFTILKREGIHTCVDTSGATFRPNDTSAFDELLPLVDLFLLDIKEYNDETHKRLTGRSNETILAFARYLSERKKPMWVRYVLVPGLTDNEDDMRSLRAFLDTLTNVEKVEVLPYHTMGKVKYEKLGLDYPLKDTLPPTKESVERAKELLVRRKA
ncbi:MAG: pyruvate formate lyase-activating protein [Clostridia bacterium]|nr:pyruvate formate lyase-activating protein [Clostridia bacterium]